MNITTMKSKQAEHLLRNILFTCVTVWAIIISHYSQANIIQSSGSSQPDRVSATANSQSQVSWRIGQRSSTGGQATISSSMGSFHSPEGTLLGQTPTAIQSNRLTQLGVTTLFVLNESLTVPLSIIRAAQQSGNSRIIYQRTFIDSQSASTRTASVSFQITSGAIASDLRINRIQMTFDNGKTRGVFGNKTEFSASAYISYQGTGLLEYSWEIAYPTSTNGNPIFFPLVSRKQYLLSGGQVTLQSPLLPSDQVGNYLVRLNIGNANNRGNNANNRERIPTMTYTINSSTANNSNSQLAKLIQQSPLVDAFLMPSTEFKWQATQGAFAYQLELHTKPIHNINPIAIEQELPVTGVLIPASKTRLKIGKVSRTYLIPGNNYFWRVIAINEAGQIIARSEFRKIRF